MDLLADTALTLDIEGQGDDRYESDRYTVKEWYQILKALKAGTMILFKSHFSKG
jgi:hypothetical protein